MSFDSTAAESSKVRKLKNLLCTRRVYTYKSTAPFRLQVLKVHVVLNRTHEPSFPFILPLPANR